MKEISHKGLAQMVGTFKTSPIKLETLEIIVNAAVEPDRIDKIRFSEDFFYGIKWLYNHTIGAKDLATKFFNKSYDAYIRNNNSWSKELGLSFHFITDWGTPHHFLTSNSNPVLDLTKAGAKLGGTIGVISEPGTSNLDDLKGFIKGALIGGGVSSGIGLIFLHLAHRNFENRCDERWKENLQLIKEIFKIKAGHQKIPSQLDIVLDHFEEKMNNLSQLRDNLPVNWIDNCSDVKFAEYMVEIALVMDFVFKVVIMKR